MVAPILRNAASLGDAAAAAIRSVAQPWVTLGVRLWLAQAFLVMQIGMMMGDPAASLRLDAPLGAGWWSGLAMHVAHCGPGSAVQALCPLLLAAGLGTRPAALAMLIEAVLLPLPAASQALRPFWIGLLAWIAAGGPGPFAIDRLLGRGLRRSAVPGAALASAAYLWAARRLCPVILLALRLWLAAAIVSLAWSAMAAIHALYMSAKAARDDVQTGMARFQRFGAKAAFPTIEPGYVDRIHDLLRRFRMPIKRDSAELDRALGSTTLERWATDRIGEGHEIYVAPDLYDGTFAKPIDTLSVAQFRELADAVKSIAHVGRGEQSVLVDGIKADLRALAAVAYQETYFSAKPFLNESLEEQASMSQLLALAVLREVAGRA